MMDILGRHAMEMKQQPGIYFLIRDGRVVYVGKSTCVFARCSSHKSSASKKFDKAVYIPCASEHLKDAEEAFIWMLDPVDNLQILQPGSTHVRRVGSICYEWCPGCHIKKYDRPNTDLSFRLERSRVARGLPPKRDLPKTLPTPIAQEAREYRRTGPVETKISTADIDRMIADFRGRQI